MNNSLISDDIDENVIYSFYKHNKHQESQRKKEKHNKTIRNQGRTNQIRAQAEKKELDKQRVDDLVKKSNRVIFSVSSLFPWTFFPNTITVEESKIIFTFRQLFSTQSHSVDIKDVSNVFIQTSPFFSTLQIISRTFVKNNISVSHLDKKDADKTRTIIEGLRTFKTLKINTSNYEIDELLAKINEINTRKKEAKTTDLAGQFNRGG